MSVEFIGIDPHTDRDHCPTVWVDAEAQEILFQGWKPDSATTTAECEATSPANGPMPAFPSAGTGIYYMSGAVPALDSVQLDTDHGAAFLDTQPHLVMYGTVLDPMESCSLEPSRSRDLIRRVAAEL